MCKECVAASAGKEVQGWSEYRGGGCTGGLGPRAAAPECLPRQYGTGRAVSRKAARGCCRCGALPITWPPLLRCSPPAAAGWRSPRGTAPPAAAPPPPPPLPSLPGCNLRVGGHQPAISWRRPCRRHPPAQAGPGPGWAPGQAGPAVARRRAPHHSGSSWPSVEKSSDTNTAPGGKGAASAHSPSMSDLRWVEHVRGVEQGVGRGQGFEAGRGGATAKQLQNPASWPAAAPTASAAAGGALTASWQTAGPLTAWRCPTTTARRRRCRAPPRCGRAGGRRR